IPTDLISGLTENLLRICLEQRNNNSNNLSNHPYWKFQLKSTNDRIYYCNPMDVHLDNENQLISCSDGTRQFKLPLTIVRLMYDELMKHEQPLTNPSALANNFDTRTTTDFVRRDVFKGVDDPHEFHLAISLWRKQPDETKFYRYGDIHYINDILKTGKQVT
ncbi:unnamed protein product, partial [Rotaria sordida]